MPAKTSKSSLFAKYGAKFNSAVKDHADDPTDYGSQGLPPGITNGIAQLTECKFDEYKSGQNEGEVYFRCEGVVIEPHSITDVNDPEKEIEVRGRKTSIMIPCCQTETQKGKITTQEENIARVLNALRMLGGEDFTAGIESAEDLEGLAETLREAKPYFKFSTSVRKPMKAGDAPGVWENWYGAKGLEEYTPPDVDEVEEEKPEPSTKTTKPQMNGKKAETPPARMANPTKGKKAKEPEPTPDVEDADVNALAEAGDSGDADAANTLREMALAAGVSESDVDGADNWAEVAALIMSLNEGAEVNAPEGAAEQGAAEEYTPSKGDITLYTVVDPKKKTKKKVECEVVEVFPKNKTAKLKNLDNPKVTYEKVAWDKLEEPE